MTDVEAAEEEETAEERRLRIGELLRRVFCISSGSLKMREESRRKREREREAAKKSFSVSFHQSIDGG